MQECLRETGSCFSKSSQYYEITHAGLDAMVRRTVQEASLLAVDRLADIGPGSSRWSFLWNVTYVDLMGGMHRADDLYMKVIMDAFESQKIIHIALLVICAVAAAGYVLLLLRPYLGHVSRESKRVAELLVQLPPEMDVEGMVASAWGAVQQERIQADVERFASLANVWAATARSFTFLSFTSNAVQQSKMLGGVGGVGGSGGLAGLKMGLDRNGGIGGEDDDEDDDGSNGSVGGTKAAGGAQPVTRHIGGGSLARLHHAHALSGANR